MRVVLDTNVIVSALIFPGGAPEAVYRLGIEGQLQLITSRPLLVELGRVLTTKFGWQRDRAEEAVGQFARLSDLVAPKEAVKEVADDPSDDRVLEAAAAGEADVIVSGDRHLLRLGTWRSIPIERPAEFLRRFNAR